MRLIFIRHAEPDYTIDSLTEKGWREAELLSDRVRNWKVDAFYCSPLGRAKDTASLTMKKTGREPVIQEWLKEFYIPVIDPVTGKKRIPWDLMPEYYTNQPLLFDKDRWLETDIMKTGDVAMNYHQVCDGIDGILAAHGYRRDGGFYRFEESSDETIVFFCHLGVSFTMMSHLLGLSPSVLWQGFFVAPSSVTILASEEREPRKAFFRCQLMGDTYHLRKEGEPISASGYFTDVFQG